MMKRLLLASAIAVCTLPAAHADSLGVFFGAYGWNADYSGNINDTDADESVDVEDDLGFSDDSSGVYYIALEHPIPILPNIRLQHTAMDTTGNGRLTTDFTLDDVDFDVGDAVASKLDLTHTDVTLYYQVLDNWFNLDIGLTARVFDGEIKVDSFSEHAQVDIDATLPMIYVNTQFDLPVTGLSLGIGGNAVAFSGSSLLDINGYVQYVFPFGLGLLGGYRTFALDLDDVDDLDTDLTLDGPYAALIFQF